MENLDNEEFGIYQLCREAGISRSHLHAKLKALVGISTSHFVRSIRLHEAKKLLQDSGQNVSEVSFAVWI